MYTTDHVHIADVLRELGWLPTTKLADYFNLYVMHKLLTCDQPIDLRRNLSFNHESVARTTHQSCHLTLARLRNDYGNRTLAYRVLKLCTVFNHWVIDHNLHRLSI